jgi:predicted O-methyltransferase YrrM
LGSRWISRRKRPIYAIDPFTENRDSTGEYGNYFNDFKKNIQGFYLENYIIPIMKYSYEAIHDCPEHISALFVDGNHDYENVKRDIELYAPRIVNGGLIAFHDFTTYPDVKKAVDELSESREYVYVADYDSLRLMRKL